MLAHLSPYHVQPLKVLLIEDSSEDVLLLRDMLDEVSPYARYDIDDVSGLHAALELRQLSGYNLILLDLNLMDATGSNAVSALHACVPFIPIIVYSGVDDPKLRGEALMHGAEHFLVKGKESGNSMRSVIEATLVDM